jgi:hypothetical protein
MFGFGILELLDNEVKGLNDQRFVSLPRCFSTQLPEDTSFRQASWASNTSTKNKVHRYRHH